MFFLCNLLYASYSDVYRRSSMDLLMGIEFVERINSNDKIKFNRIRFNNVYLFLIIFKSYRLYIFMNV